MSPNDENPCGKGLTPECFKAHPAFAKRALAARLLHLLFPPAITVRLPGKFREALAFPGSGFPPGWLPGDPWPDSPYFWDAVNWPEGYYGPPGTFPPPAPPEGLPDGPLPPIFLPPFEPGPVHIPTSAPEVSIYSFSEEFTTLDTDIWTVTAEAVSTVDIVVGRLRFLGVSGDPTMKISRTDADATPENYDLSFLMNYISGATFLCVTFYNGTYAFNFRLFWSTYFGIWNGMSWQYEVVGSIIGSELSWKFSVTGGTCVVYINNTPIASSKGLESNTSNTGRLEIWANGVQSATFDTLVLQET